MDSRGTKDGESAIDMDLEHWKGTKGLGSHLGLGQGVEPNLISNRVILEVAAKVGTTVVVINDGLAALTDELDVSQQWNGKEHVAMENQRARGHTKSGVSCSAQGSVHGSNAVVKELQGRLNISGWMLREESAKLVTNCLVDALSNGVACGIASSGGNRLNAIGLKHCLKGQAGELRAIVVDASERLGVAS